MGLIDLYGNKGETQTNLQLNEAAPDLLLACKQAIKIFETFLPQIQEMQIIYEAIKKAENK